MLLITFNTEANSDNRAMDYISPPTKYVYYYGYIKENEEIINEIYSIAIYDENVNIGEDKVIYDIGCLVVRYDTLYLDDKKYNDLLELKKQIKEKYNTTLKIFN